MKRRPGRDAHLEALMQEVSAIMDERKITQAELARRMHTDPGSISKVLKLKVDPLASTLVAMLNALGCHLSMTPKKSTSAIELDA